MANEHRHNNELEVSSRLKGRQALSFPLGGQACCSSLIHTPKYSYILLHCLTISPSLELHESHCAYRLQSLGNLKRRRLNRDKECR